ncbi:GNAT family N-acetyltransferase [Sphingomonas sp. BGYR3]|uniref:GNAT family N-acetyltransferase n=1 Tax=Sphingomonas sp. BGYR3 TaxID=2975483 RepID=UPI0021A345B3|nr:GNAT family N-acetyltransferase [Sphingomonas sp. BGYR3]
MKAVAIQSGVPLIAPSPPWPVHFQVGARTILTVRRRLSRVPLGLDAVLADAAPVLPPLLPGEHGYLVTSLPVQHVAALTSAGAGLLVCERQRYTRFHTDLSIGFDAWFAALSGNTRSGLKRKEKKLASAGRVRIERYRSPAEVAAFHPLARQVAARTYQERLLDAALPADDGYQAEMLALAAAGRARGWILSIDDRPVAYLWCPVSDGIVRYEHVGHDPAWNDWSPGSVLHLTAMRDLFAEGTLAQFDFTEGEGQHKRQLATGGVACADLLLLRPGLSNRALIGALSAFDGGVAFAKRALGSDWARRLRR